MLATEGHDYQLVDSESDKEIRPVISVNKVCVQQPTLTSGFKNYSTWKSLVERIAYLKHIARSWSRESSCTGWHSCIKAKDINLLKETEKLIIREAQMESFGEEIEQLRNEQPIKKGNAMKKLNPFMDSDGILRVGGRLNQAPIDVAERNPIIIHGKHHFPQLIIRHYHILTKHQGRHYTEGAIRAAGFLANWGKAPVVIFIFQLRYLSKA